MAVINLLSNQRIESLTMVDVKGVDKTEYLTLGYFIEATQNILFVNSKYVIQVTRNSAVVLNKYQKVYDFQTAVSLFDNHFAVVENSLGFTIYQYIKGNNENNNTSSIKNITKFTILDLKPTYRNLQIKDLIYWPFRDVVILLDQFEGIKTYRVSRVNNAFNLHDGQIITKARGCKLMYVYRQNLYASCNQLYKFDLSDWPKVKQVQQASPNLQIRQIYQMNDTLAFVGRNSFDLMYLGRLVNNFEERSIDKIAFFEDFFISADEEKLTIGKMSLIKPYVSCYTQNDQFLGETKLVFRTKAQCNEKFLLQNNINLGIIQEDDICIYSYYRNVVFWKPGQIYKIPLIIGGCILGALLVGFGIFYYMKKLRLKSYIQMIQQYSISPMGDSAKPHELNQDLDIVPDSKLPSGQNLKGTQNEIKSQNLSDDAKNANDRHKVEIQNNSQHDKSTKQKQVQLPQIKE